MLDPDISTEDAKRLLSISDITDPDDRLALDRRRFLQMVGWGVGAGAMIGGLGEAIAPDLVPGRLREAWAGNPIGPTDGILVVLGFDGGNDFLNTFVPYNNSNYYAQRPGFAIPGAQTLPLNNIVNAAPTGSSTGIGLNNRLPYLKSLYDRGEVAVVQGVGYPNPDLSHFTSMGYWMAGRTSTPTSGWIGRWLDGRPTNDLFSVATVGHYLPLSLIGVNRRGTAIPPWGLGFGSDTGDADLRMYEGVRDVASATAGRGVLHDAMAAGMKGVVDVGQEVAPIFERPIPESDLQRKLTVAARLINADLGLRIIDTAYGGFDTHSSQPGTHGELMVELDAALRAFFTTLDDRFRSRVTIMTYSEFGRTSYSNDSDGTDHGTAATHMFIGRAVNGGMFGQMPNLANLDPWDRLEHHVDFRAMYTSAIDGWMGGGASSVLGGTFGTYGNVFKAAPGAGVATGSVPATVLGDYQSLTPYRIYNSRVGMGTRQQQLGAGTTAEVEVTGIGGVPSSGVTAVAVNVVSVAATEKTRFTVWPTGDVKPDVANVRSEANRAVPSLVLVKVGKGGRINVLNDLGATDCIIDVAGYFRTAAGDRLQSLTPVRVLNTRTGIGGRSTPLGAAQSMNLQVAGVNGVPSNATAVVINVTAVQPTAKSYATVWPAGATRPTAASLNFEIGQTVPNLVIARVGTGGAISIYNNGGSTHFIGDVLGYMLPATAGPGRYFPVPAAKVLDTRAGAKVGAASTTAVTVTGGSVPSNATAVAVNLSAIAPTMNSFITAWPNGETRPVSANLNPLAGADVANLAIVKVGTSGRIQLYNQNGSTHLVAEVVGYFSA